MSYAKLPEKEIELFKQLPDLNVIFDVGARDDTEYYDIYPNAEYHLFEPNPEFVDSLKAKVGDKPNVYINAVGVSNTDGEAPYSDSVQAFMFGEAPVASSNKVFPLMTLDRYAAEQNITKVDFLKVDVEGYDYKVLLGAPKTIHRTRFIQYEHWNNRQQYYCLLGEHFDMEYVGYRNVLCMNKHLVDMKTRNRIREYIDENGLHLL